MQRIQIVGLLIAATLAIAGCEEKGEQVGKTPTVGVLLHDADLFRKTMNDCKNDPAQNSTRPACVNVSEAAYRKGLLPCFNKGQIDHACLEQRGYER